MKRSENHVSLAGCISEDIAVKTDKDGVKYCYVRIAAHRESPLTGLDLISAKFRDLDAEFCAAQFKKGDYIAVTGPWTVDNYIKNGVKTYANYVLAKTVTPPLTKEASP